MTIQTDTHYRGYRLVRIPRYKDWPPYIAIYQGTELIDEGAHTLDQAKQTIDEWMEGR